MMHCALVRTQVSSWRLYISKRLHGSLSLQLYKKNLVRQQRPWPSTTCRRVSSQSGRNTAPTTKKISGVNDKSMAMDAAKAFGIGSMAGLLGSLAGMGGGFVMIPLMTSLLRLSQHQAHGTSLFAVAATGLAGAWSYGTAVQWEPAAAVALTGMVTARMGARATTVLSERSLKRALGVLMLIMSAAVPVKAHWMEQYQKEEVAMEETSANSKQGNDARDACSDNSVDVNYSAMLGRVVPAAAIGTCSGFMAGLFGVGGGVIVVPALTVFTSCNHYQALATSLAAMSLPAMTGTWTHYCAGNVAMRVAPGLAVGALAGAAVGGQIGRRINESTLRWGCKKRLQGKCGHSLHGWA